MSIVDLRPERRGAAGRVTGPAPVGRCSGLRVVAAVTTLAVLTVVAGLALTGDSTATGQSAGLADAGRVTTWLLPVSRSLFDLAAVGTIGTVTALAWLVPQEQRAATHRLRRAVAAWAAVWAVAAVVTVLVSASQVVGVPLRSLVADTDLLWYGVDLPQGRATLLAAVGAVAMALWIGTVRTVAGLRVWAVVAPALLAPLLTTGHAATASNHFLATQMLLVHVVSVTLWMGGLLALVVHVRAVPEALPTTVARFSRLALVCFAAVGVSGLVGAWTRLGLSASVWDSSYGALLVLKTAALVVLGVLGWEHRRRSLPALAAGRPRAFARVAVVELGVMAVAIGLAVVLARTAPPIAATLRAVPPHAASFPTVDPTLQPLTPWNALAVTRPDALQLSALVLAVGLLLVWLRTVGTMDRARWLSLGAGLLVTGWAVVGALGAYSTALLSAQVAQVVVLALVAPPLLVRGLPPDRVQAVAAKVAAGPIGALMQPTNAVLALVLLVGLVFQTPLLAASLRSEGGHLLLAVAALAVGLVLALATPTQGRPRAALLLLAGVLGWYGFRMWTTSTPYAGGWFRDLDLWWADAAVDQQYAGLVAVAAGVVVALVALRRDREGDPA